MILGYQRGWEFRASVSGAGADIPDTLYSTVCRLRALLRLRSPELPAIGRATKRIQYSIWLAPRESGGINRRHPVQTLPGNLRRKPWNLLAFSCLEHLWQ